MNCLGADAELYAPREYVEGLNVLLVAVRASAGGAGAQLLLDHVQLRKYRLDEPVPTLAPKAFALTRTT
jgi:hypothetical protein